jgi:hypothetical protein
LARAAIMLGSRLDAMVEARLAGATEELIDLPKAYIEGRVLAPIDHPDPAHLLVTGTGLSHLGSAESRDKMHKDMADPAKQTDSMKMFKMGIEGGKPKRGAIGVQPEWFYKGDGTVVVPPGAPFPSPEFAWDGGDEGEIVGVYVVGPDGARELPLSRPLEAAALFLRAGTPGRRSSRPCRRPRRGHSRRQGDVGKDLLLGRGEYVPLDRQSRVASFQISAVPAAGRRPYPLFRCRNPELPGWRSRSAG